MTKRCKLIILEILSFFVSITPLLIVLIVNWGDYTKTPSDTVKLCIGGILVIIFIVLKAIGKLKIPAQRVVTYSIVFVMCWLLNAVMQDLVLISGMALLGEVLDWAILQHQIKKLREEIHIDKTADATSIKVEETIKKYINNGRT